MKNILHNAPWQYEFAVSSATTRVFNKKHVQVIVMLLDVYTVSQKWKPLDV